LFACLPLPKDVAIDMIKLLIGAGANPDVTAANGETPMGLALARPEPALQQWLNWHAWKLPLRALRNHDVLSAAACGDVSAVSKLLGLGFSIDVTDAQGATPLLRAAGSGHADVVAFLLDNGADATKTAASGGTALSAAVIARSPSVIAALVSHGVPIDQRLKGGGTALMIASAMGYPEIIAALLNAGADVNSADDSHTRALHAASHFAFHGRDAERAQRTLEALLDRGADVDARNSEGQTALLLLLGAHAEAGAAADQKALLAMMPLLLKRHADIDAADNRSVTALHACAMHGLLLPARALVAAGADTQVRDMRERTPREVAHLLGFIDVAKELAPPELVTPNIRPARKAANEFE
jgi:ankyrin repeat protein